MNIKKIFQDISPFNDSYTEKDAIRGHSVDRYAYACQLINENTNESLIKAYAWLNVAAQEVDKEKPAKQLMNKVGFELKKRGLFDEASTKCQQYYDMYSPEALRAKINSSKNPIHYLLRISFKFITLMINQIEFFDARIIKNRGGASLWFRIALSSSCIGMVAMGFWFKNNGYLSSTFLVLALLSCVFSSALYEKRLESSSKEY